MARPSSQATSIGIFVLAALSLFLVLLLALGGGRLFSQTVTYKLRLHTSVRGLSPGAHVKFRGVTVGQVKEINLLSEVLETPDVTVAQTTMPVTVTLELMPESFGFNTGWLVSFFTPKGTNVESTRELIQKLVADRGLQVEVKILSMLTGQKYLEMSVSDEPVTEEERQRRLHLLKKGYLPHKQTAMDRLAEQLTRRDFSRHLNTAYTILDQVEGFIKQGGLQNMLAHLESFTANLDAASAKLPALMDDAAAATATTRRVAEKVEQVVAQLEPTLADVRKLTQDLDVLAMDGAREIPALASDLRALAAKADTQLDNINKLLKQLQSGTAEDSPLRKRVDALLDDCSQAASRLSTLMEMLSQDPQMFLLGR